MHTGEEIKTGLHEILDAVAIPTAYKIGYVSNYYREPSFREIEKAYGLTRPEILSLIFLCFRDGITASEICDFSGHLKPNISRAVNALEKKGLIERRPDHLDQRKQLLFVKKSGRVLHDAFMPGLVAREKAMKQCLSQVEQKQLEALLHKMCLHAKNWGHQSVV